MVDHDVILAPQAAEEKGCSRGTIYNALDRGDLTELRRGRIRLVVKDEKYEAFEPKIKHRPYRQDDNS